MKIEFELKDFENEKHWLVNTLSQLKRKSRFKRTRESDEFFAKTPALAYKYVEYLISEYRYDPKTANRVYKNTKINKLDVDLEKVFSKNCKYALKYLIITGQKRFKDDKLNITFFNKLYKEPFFCFVYSLRVLNGKRIPIDKEDIFLKNYNCLYQYAKQIIKGRFDKKLDDKINMLTFSQENKKRYDYQYLENYVKNIDDPKNQKDVSTYYGIYF